jgi:hypothetical protein
MHAKNPLAIILSCNNLQSDFCVQISFLYRKRIIKLAANAAFRFLKLFNVSIKKAGASSGLSAPSKTEIRQL